MGLAGATLIAASVVLLAVAFESRVAQTGAAILLLLGGALAAARFLIR